MATSNLYTPLPADHIRVLVVHGTEAYQRDDSLVLDLAIRCSLETEPLAHVRSGNTSYQALSYTWGSRSHRRPVLCNGQTIWATPNLYDALWHLLAQAKALPLRLWVDALCIDQRNTDDKAQQIILMGDIYRNAVKVLV